MTKFLKPSARALNIVASGQATDKVKIDQDLSAGRVRPRSLIHSIMNCVSANELVMHLIGSDPDLTSYTLVSTHPGFLHTDLHAAQGKLFEILSSVAVAAAGVSAEEAGLQQASILASPKLHPQSISYRKVERHPTSSVSLLTCRCLGCESSFTNCKRTSERKYLN
jgi:hypothetical protein